MRLSRPLIAAAGVVLAGVAVAGVGAGATFSTSASSSQKITAGTLRVSLSADGATCAKYNSYNDCVALTLPDVAPQGSTFETPVTKVWVTNTGNIPATFDNLQLSAATDGSSASSVLRNEMDVCIQTTDPQHYIDASPNAEHTWVEARGPLLIADALHPTVTENTVVLNKGESFPYWVTFYAGQDSANCANPAYSYSDGSHTSAAWYAANGNQSYTTPASLTNAAEGGVVTPTLTFTFTG